MDWKEGPIEGVEIKPLQTYTDERGWLAELFRSDEIDATTMPAMSYVSVTHPGVARGPHEHTHQTDMFAFCGPGRFRTKLWDNRESSPSYGNMMTVVGGEGEPVRVIVPPGVVHGYQNISDQDAWVLNFPNQLFAGEGKQDPVDETRHEERNDGMFCMNNVAEEK